MQDRDAPGPSERLCASWDQTSSIFEASPMLKKRVNLDLLENIQDKFEEKLPSFDAVGKILSNF